MTVSPATTPGQILTSAYLNNNINSGLTYITGGALTTSATNFAGCFTSTYDNYRIVMSSLAFSSNDSIFWRILTGTTPITAVNYAYAYSGYTEGNVAKNEGGTSQDKAYMGVTATVTGSATASLSMDIYAPALAQRTLATISALSIDSSYYHRTGMTSHNLQTAYDGIRFFTNGATLTGNVAIYGYRKA